MSIDEAQARAAINGVVDPELGLSLGSLKMTGLIQARRRKIAVEVVLPVAGWPNLDDLRTRVTDAAHSAGGAEDVEVDISWSIMDDDTRAELRRILRGEMEGGVDGPHHLDVTNSSSEGNRHDHGNGHGNGHGHDHAGSEAPTPTFLRPESKTRVIGIASGKGGVGKSSVTVNLSIALAQLGHSVGVLDADVYGFSIPKMFGTDHDPIVLGDLVIPAAAHGVRVLSMGFFVPDEQPVIWRGPMLHKAIEQFLADAYWGSPDFLLVDMPPGTGDVTLTLAQTMSRAEIIVVTTPQPAAQRVAQRAAYAARKLKLSVRGVIENMSWFTDDQGKRYELFGSGGGQALAEDMGVPLLGRIPLVEPIRAGGDEGAPMVVTTPDCEAAMIFKTIAERIAKLGPARVYRRELAVR